MYISTIIRRIQPCQEANLGQFDIFRSGAKAFLKDAVKVFTMALTVI